MNKSTSVPKTGRSTWTVTLKKGAYRVGSDAHPSLKRSLTVR